MIAFNSARLAAYFFTISARFCSRLISASFAMATSVSERKFKCGEKRFRFVVSLRGGRDANVHTAQCVDLVVLDFRENDLFLDADVIVAATIECTPGNTSEVAQTKKNNRKKKNKKHKQKHTTQRHQTTNRITFANLESRDCLAS